MARILIVEDDPPNIEILQRLLASAGHETVVAQSKNAALAAASDGIDLILMDIGIPNDEGGEVNRDGGLEATQSLKSNADTQSIPIIATSASAMLDEKRRFLAAGCDDVQSKPYEFAALLDSIKQRLE